MSSKITIINLSQSNSYAVTAQYCNTFLCRLRGLTFFRNLPKKTGILLALEKDSRLGSSIHMFFMWMDLAVVWIDSSLMVVDLILAKRWRPAYLPSVPARYVLELPGECLANYAIGDLLKFEQNT